MCDWIELSELMRKWRGNEIRAERSGDSSGGNGKWTHEQVEAIDRQVAHGGGGWHVRTGGVGALDEQSRGGARGAQLRETSGGHGARAEARERHAL